MKRVFIFNPETDYALAAGNVRYNPPAKILRLRKDLQLIQAFVATKGDIIGVTQDFDVKAYPYPSHLEMVSEKELSLIPIQELPYSLQKDSDSSNYNQSTSQLRSNFRVIPWGWNHSLRSELLSIGLDSTLLPTETEIETLRNLSHRHTTIPFQQKLQKLLPDMEIPIAKEFESVNEALEYTDNCEEVYFKAPWSSSGRGVVTSKSLSKEKLKEWIGGFIKKQGSVMGEKGFDRKADFATEWICKKGEASFMGYSLFNTTSEGRYIGNATISQEDIIKTISRYSTDWNNDIVEAQRKALNEIISPLYKGPVGIDMLIDTTGRINPCVEINLRMTMGMINLKRELFKPIKQE